MPSIRRSLPASPVVLIDGKSLTPVRQVHARAALEILRNHAGLSRDLFEIVDKQLG
jgi:hypothetical protein